MDEQEYKNQQQKQVKKKKIIGNYQLLQTLGQGTFGKVKQAKHLLTGQLVAIKILQKNKIVDVADVQRVSRQIHILKLLRHPSIIQLYQIIQTPKQLFLVMEYLCNGQLFDYIVKHKRIKEPQACKLFQQFVNGIQYIHKLHIVHRDLKPQNLLLDFNQGLKMVDFGLSNTYKKDQLLKTACGSPCYAAPQMIKALKYNGLLVDIWSSGVILFAMLCGYLPFEDPNTSKLYNKILHGEYQIPKFVSNDARDLINKILTIDPDKRFTIDDIRKHKWWSLNKNIKPPSGIIVGYNRVPVDKQILLRLSTFSFDADYVQKCIQANRHNHATTAYHLLLKKHLRQGGKSIADLSDQNFDMNLIDPIRKIKTLGYGKQYSIQKDEKKRENRINSFVLPRGKVGSTGDSIIKGEYNKNIQLKADKKVLPMSTKNDRRPYHVKQELNDKIKKQYRQSYGLSLISKSNKKPIKDQSIRQDFPYTRQGSRQVSKRNNSREKSKQANKTIIGQKVFGNLKSKRAKQMLNDSAHNKSYHYKRKVAYRN